MLATMQQRYWRRMILKNSRLLVAAVISCVCLYITLANVLSNKAEIINTATGGASLSSSSSSASSQNGNKDPHGSDPNSNNGMNRHRRQDLVVQLEGAENPMAFGEWPSSLSSSSSLEQEGGGGGEGGLTARFGLAMKTVRRQLELAERAYQRQVALRNQVLERFSFKPGEPFDAWDPDHRMYWWNYFPAAFQCPHQVERYGPIDDGGRWMCGMEIYADAPRRPKCVVYSFGLRDETRWEEQILERTDCEVWGFGSFLPHMGAALRNNPRMHFEKIHLWHENKIDGSGTVWQTLPTIMRRLGHTWIDILKVDLEGGEYETFHQLLDHYQQQKQQDQQQQQQQQQEEKGKAESTVLPFSQLQIELHVRSIAFDAFLAFWRRCEDAGLRPFWTELNGYPPVFLREVPWASEYSFINIKGDQRNLLLQDY